MKTLVLSTILASTLSSSAFADNSACGHIQEIKLPSYTFQVKGEDGGALSQVPAAAKLGMSQPVWSGDHWGYKDASIEITLSYNKDSNTYSTEAKDVKVPSHLGCSDVVSVFAVSFNFFPKDAAGFDITRNNQSFKYSFPRNGNYQLPDSSTTQTITLGTLAKITGVFADNTHIVDASGKSTLVSYEGTAGGADPDPAPTYSTAVLTGSELQVIVNSLTNKSPVTIYGSAGDEDFLINNVQSN